MSLTALLSHTRDRNLVAAASPALALLGPRLTEHPESLESTRNALHHAPLPESRILLLRALSLGNDLESLERALLHDKVAEVRGEALKLIVENQGEQAAELILRRLDKDPPLRRDGARLLARIPGERIERELLRRFNDSSNPEIVSLYARALIARPGGRLSEIEAAALDDSPRTLIVIDALLQSHRPDHLATLKTVLERGQSVEARARALRALNNRKQLSSQQLTLIAEQDPSPAVRALAQRIRNRQG